MNKFLLIGGDWTVKTGCLFAMVIDTYENAETAAGRGRALLHKNEQTWCKVIDLQDDRVVWSGKIQEDPATGRERVIEAGL